MKASTLLSHLAQAIEQCGDSEHISFVAPGKILEADAYVTISQGVERDKDGNLKSILSFNIKSTEAHEKNLAVRKKIADLRANNE